ncbi:MAG: DUF896 domain-containing protein [Peptostreptococcaceae bacterium]|nr:DUF896 domain-containing protein [Peptostreptococcaceae bacterium]
MIEKKRLDRINQLARKQKDEGLTKEEKEEQRVLREEYLKSFRKQFRKQLDSIKIVDEKEDKNGQN